MQSNHHSSSSSYSAAFTPPTHEVGQWGSALVSEVILYGGPRNKMEQSELLDADSYSVLHFTCPSIREEGRGRESESESEKPEDFA